jgi:hypothetical protein
MKMDVQMFFNFGASAALAGIGWFARQLWDAVSMLRKDLHRLERELPHYYVRRDDFLEHTRRVEDMLSKIFDKLDAKQDK